jgi:glycosyltransferase involved in cell wall biosynthesis
MKSAILHDWLTSSVGGAEKCTAAIHALFPSPIYTLIKDTEALKGSYFEGKEIFPSWIQKLPWARKKFRHYLPLFPLAIEDFDLSEYDCLLSSSHCVAKGVITHPHQLHICYCHTPVRYAWDLMHFYLEQSSLNKGLKGFFVKKSLHSLRNWDVHSSSRVDLYIANSKYVARRIEKYYGKPSTVIYPPVDLSYFELCEQKEDFYLTASRLVPYKKIDLIVEAFRNRPSRKLIVIGEGPEMRALQLQAPPNVEFLGYQPNSVLRSYLQKARAFLFAAIEDFGILPVEAMGCGTPVIAFQKGGLEETVKEGLSGLFFEEQTPASLQEAIDRFEKSAFHPRRIKAHAEQFSKERFNREYKEFVESAWKEKHR